MSLLWDVDPSAPIQKPLAAGASTAGRAKQLASLIGGLEARVDRLNLICRAMWSFIQETTDLTEESLLERVKDLDLRDGKLDGKLARKVSQCGRCGKVMSTRHNRCLYCGDAALVDTVFDQV